MSLEPEPRGDERNERGESDECDGASARWEYTNDVLVFVVVGAWLGVWAYLHVTPGSVPWLLDVSAILAALTAIAWGFGGQAMSNAVSALTRTSGGETDDDERRENTK